VAEISSLGKRLKRAFRYRVHASCFLVESDENPLLQVEVVGSVEEGITAAAWSPDDSILVLVTGAFSHF
jgi:hypothetical protein